MPDDMPLLLSPSDFAREDESDDRLFYRDPRLVVHIDDQAIDTIGRLFVDVIAPDASVLDLMSSWRSHWPVGHPKASMVGLGLNAAEMGENPDLDSYVVHDINRDPDLPFDDAVFDAVVITVSIQYLTGPIEVFEDVGRILKHGGLLLVIFSNRMFPTKAVRIWRMSDDEQRMRLLIFYMHNAGGFEDIRRMELNPRRGYFDDPVYAVMAKKLPLQARDVSS